MTTQNLQPLESLGPMPKNDNPADLAPGRKEYLEARKLLDNGKYTEAAMGFHNALRAFEEAGDRIGAANAADRLGDACMGREEWAMALANFERAFAVCVAEEDSFSQLSLNKKMARCLRKLGQTAMALAVYDDMLEHYRLTKNPKGAVDTLEQIAETSMEAGDRQGAAAAWRAAAGVHRNFKHTAAAEDFLKKAEAAERG